MLRFAPDFARRIDLPGAGPCPRPVDIDRATTGFAKLVALRVYSFAKGVAIDGEAEDDEVFIVLLRGRVDIGVDSGSRRIGEYSLGGDDGLRAVYLPPRAAYRLNAPTDCDIAYARAQPPRPHLKAASGFASVENRLSVVGYAATMDLRFERLSAGEALALVGRDGGLPERFLHVRSDRKGAAIVSGERIGDWESMALRDGESATLEVASETIDILMIAATTP